MGRPGRSSDIDGTTLSPFERGDLGLTLRLQAQLAAELAKPFAVQGRREIVAPWPEGQRWTPG